MTTMPPADHALDPGPPPADALLAAIVAHHLDGGTVEAGTARSVAGNVVVECTVDEISPLGDVWAAACFFGVSGGRLGETPIFASISGMGSTPAEAVGVGGSTWADMLASILRVSDGAAVPPGDDVHQCEVTLDGRDFTLVVACLDRALAEADASPPGGPDEDRQNLSTLRHQLGGSHWLLPTLVRGGRIPPVAGDDAVLLSLFVGELPTGRVVELKVHGVDQDTAGVLDSRGKPIPGLPGALLRELGILVPRTAP